MCLVAVTWRICHFELASCHGSDLDVMPHTDGDADLAGCYQ